MSAVDGDVELARRVVPYVPGIVLRRLAAAPEATAAVVPGTLLFADVSGFTRVSERLARIGREGAEHIAEAVGASFAALLEVAEANGGELLKFGGDALLLFFEDEGHAERACRAAMGMRAALRTAGRLAVPGARATLRMSVGVHSDALHLFLVGGSHREPVVCGPASSTVLRMQRAARPGDVVVSPQAAALLPPRVLGAPAGGGRLLRAAPPGGEELAPPAARPPEPGALAAACLSSALREHLREGEQAPEHRIATVAFLRFGGTDALVRRHGAAAAEALEELVCDVQAAADEHGVAFLGSDVDVDGGKLLLSAGAPRVTGDEEQRMLAALRRVVERRRRLAAGAGADRGLVFAGDVGPRARRTYTAMGDVVNVAARLAARAPAGEVYATAAVLERSRARFAATALEPLAVKGKARPLAAWSVGRMLAARAAPDEPPPVPLIGREDEAAALGDALRATRRGDGRLVELAGDPGIGKTRLLEEVRRTAGAPVLHATCEPHHGAAPYGVWRELLLQVLGLGWDDDLEAVLAALRATVEARSPALLPWLPLLAIPLGLRVPPTREVEALSAAFRPAVLHDSVLRLLDATLPAPAVIQIEQAHHMDAASADLLRAVVQALPGRPWLVLTTRRDDPAGFAAPDLPQAVSLRLPPLDRTQALALAEALTEEDPAPPHVLALAAERSAGNPQFLRDLLASRPAVGAALPDSVEAAATARIDRLSAADRALLRRASVLGMSFHPRMLPAVLEGTATVDNATWTRLADVFADDGAGWLRFRHGVVRDAAYAGLPYRTRRRLHAAAGELLERELGAAAGERAAVLSLHFLLAGRHDRAWRYARAAGDRARDAYAHADAARLYRRALDAAGPAGIRGHELASAWLDLGEARARTGEPDGARDAFRRARSLLRDDPVGQAEVLHRQTELADRAGDANRAVRCATGGLRTLAGASGARAGACRAALLAALATARQRQGRSAAARKACLRAIAEGEAAGADRPVAHACYVLDWVLHETGRGAEAVHSARALEIYERLGDLDRQAAVLNNLGAWAFFGSRWEEAVGLYRRAGAASARAGDVVNAAYGDCNVGEVLAAQGRLAEAEPALRRALQVWRGTGDESGVAWATALLGRAAVHAGRAEEGRALLQVALGKSRGLRHVPEAQHFEALLCEALLFSGRAEATLQAAEALLVKLLDPRTAPLLHRTRGCALAQLEEWEGARTALERALELARAASFAYEEAAALDALEGLVAREGHPPDPARAARRDALLERLGVVRLPPAPVSL